MSQILENNFAQAALDIVACEYPGLDTNVYINKLDAYADVIRSRMPENPTIWQAIDELNQYLFEELGFEGNSTDYYNPKNSFLNDVLDRRLGIPITLSLIYIEIGQRLNLPFEGIGFPGHFLVKCHIESAGGIIILDPYARGAVLGLDELDQRLQYLFGENAPTIRNSPELLKSASCDDIVTRLLYNLKGIYIKNKEFNKALNVTNQLVQLRPDQPAEIRDRGKVYKELECYRAALKDLRKYIQLSPEADDFEQVRNLIIDMQKEEVPLH